MCCLTGHFKDILCFTIIILIHEMGHFITAKILNFKINRIEIYPYGGCSKIEYDLNVPIEKEFLVLLMGPLTQIVFVYTIWLFKVSVPSNFYYYNLFILLFNMLPIYPLDGGRFLSLLLFKLVPYYNGLRLLYYVSYVFFIVFTLLLFIYYQSFLILVIMFSIFIKLVNEILSSNYNYEKFILERYLNEYRFKKIRKIYTIRQMKRDYYHLFVESNSLVEEKKYLKRFFI